MKITIYGASDDLIEVEGDLEEEFQAYDTDGECHYMGLSDGTLLRVIYDGVWHINVLKHGEAKVDIVPADGEDDDNYSDHAMLEGDFTWIVCGKEAAQKPVKSSSPKSP